MQTVEYWLDLTQVALEAIEMGNMEESSDFENTQGLRSYVKTSQECDKGNPRRC